MLQWHYGEPASAAGHQNRASGYSLNRTLPAVRASFQLEGPKRLEAVNGEDLIDLERVVTKINIRLEVF